jgi:transcriptional regulator with XRE-family HTH domain
LRTSNIATSLRAAREHRGWTREALAYRSGISWSAIAQIESGRRPDPRLSTLRALAAALEMSVDHLMGTTPPPVLTHRLLLYSSDDDFEAAVVPFAREGVERSAPVLVVTSAERIERVRDVLGADARQVRFADSKHWYSSPPEAFRRYRDYIEDHAGAGWARVVGEPVCTGRTRAERGAWIRYEAVINLSLAAARATIMCPYDTRSVPAAVLNGARSAHPEVIGARGATPSDAFDGAESPILATHAHYR